MNRLPEDEYLRRLNSNPFALCSDNLAWVNSDEYPELASLRFDDEYISVRNWPRNPDAPPPEKTILGTPTPRTCSICLRSAHSASPARFKHEAHLVPEMLGNNWLLTYDECDECNARFGKYESELGALTLPIRAMSRTPAKRGTAKTKLHGKSSVGGGHRGAPLEIDLHADDPSVTAVIDGDHRLVVKLKGPPFRPSLAAKAMARIAWQALPYERRPAHESLREWLNSSTVGSTVLYEVDLLNFRGLAIGLWERANNFPRLSPLVLAVAFDGRLLIWGAPDWTTGKDLPILFPLLPIGIEGAEALGVKKYASEEDGVIRATTSFFMSVGSASWNDFDNPRRVRIEFNTPIADTIDTFMTRRPLPEELSAQLHAPDGSMLHEVTGGDFDGRLLVVRHEEGDLFAVLYSAGTPANGAPGSNKMAAFHAAFEVGEFKIVLPGMGVFLDVRLSEQLVPQGEGDT